MKTLLALPILFLFLSACDSKIKFQTPTNIFSEWCSTKLKMGTATVYCSESEYDEALTVNRSLIVLVEAGTVDANSSIQSSFTGIMNNPEIKVIAPHIRTIMGNIAAAFIEKTQLRYSRYDSIYVIQGETGLKSRFLKALRVASQKSQNVDLFMMAHGAPGLLLMNSQLNNNGEALTGNEINQFGSSLPSNLKGKIKNIFSTACFSAAASTSSISLLDGFSIGFPGAKVYGSTGVNYFPLHRDFTIFEEFSRTLNFESSVARGNEAVKLNTFNRTPRKYLTYPSVRGRGCVDLLFTTKCEDMVLPMGITNVAQFQIDESTAKIKEVHVASPPVAETTPATPAVNSQPTTNECKASTGEFFVNSEKVIWSCGCGKPDARNWQSQPYNCFHLKISCVTAEGSFTNGRGGKTAYVCGCAKAPDTRPWVPQANSCFHLNL